MSSRWNPRRLLGMGISTRLLIWFLLISLIPCGVLTGVISNLSTLSLKKTVRQGLLAIADAKTNQLDIYVRERRGDLTMASRSPYVVEATEQLSLVRRKESLDSPGYLERVRKVRPALANFTESFGYDNYYIFATDGTVLFQLKPDVDPGSNLLTGPLKGSELAEVFDRVRTLLQIEISDFQQYPGHREPAAFIATPVFNPSGLVVGFVAMQLKNQHVFRVFNDYNGLGDTGEAVVSVRTGEAFALVAPPRHDPEPAMKFKGRIGDAMATAMQKAVRGQRGYGEAIDYRGRPIIAAWSYLPSFRWGMVVKQDTDEAFALINRQKWAIALLLLSTIVLVTAVALWLARTITRPIREAALVTDRVASGDLTVNCEGRASGEAGLLLQAIRKMIHDLRSLIGKIQRSSITLLSTATEISAASRQQEQSVYDYSASTNQAAAAVNQISATSQELLKTMNEVNQVAESDFADGDHRPAEPGRHGPDHAATGRVDQLDRLEVVGDQRAGRQHQPGRDHDHQGRRPDQPAVDQCGDRGRESRANMAWASWSWPARFAGWPIMTAVSTLDIERMVKEMQYSVSAGVMEMDKFSEQVRKVVGEVAHIGSQLGQIITGVQGLNERFDQVTEGMRVQSQGADQIREAMSRVSEAANQTSLSIREFNKATDRLREAVGGLKEEVSGFILGTASRIQRPTHGFARSPPASMF